MPLTVGLLLALSFGVSLLALAGLIWAISNHQLKVEQEDAYTIFAEGEAGEPDVDSPKHAPEIYLNQYDVRRAGLDVVSRPAVLLRSEEHTSELQSLMRHSYAVFCLKQQKQ